MLHGQNLAIPAAKVASIYWLPISILVGGWFGWQAWQHRKNASQHKKLVKHIEALQGELKEQQGCKEAVNPTTAKSSLSSSTKPSFAVNGYQSHQQKPQNDSIKSALFEHVINENIVLRQSL